MIRAAWKRWTDEEIALLRSRSGDATAEEIASELGRTLEQVRGAVKRYGVELRPSPKLKAALNRRRSAGVTRAWRDPTKRGAMLSAIAARPLSGAAVAGTERRHGGGWDVYTGLAVVTDHTRRLASNPIYARARACAQHLPADDRDDVISHLILAELEGRATDLRLARAATRSLMSSPQFTSLDLPLPGRRSGVMGDLIASDVDHV